MPVYDYLCGECGPFTALRPMSEFQAPQPCAACGTPARRAILTAPAFAAMDGGQRRAHATNERSANAPIQSPRPASRGLRLLQAPGRRVVRRRRGCAGQELPGGAALDDQSLIRSGEAPDRATAAVVPRVEIPGG